MESSQPQLEFVDLIAEVPDSTLAVRSKKRERARELARLRREEKATELKLCAEWADCYEALGMAQMDEDDFVAAIESFQRAMEMVPSRTLYREHIAFCHICLKEFESAKDLLIDILRDDPEEAPAYVALAAYYVFADPNKEMAKKLLKRALEIDPDYCAAHRHLGGLATEEGSYEDALVHFNAILAVCPGCAWSHFMRVAIYLEQTRYTEASQAFDQMLENAVFSDSKDAELLAELKMSFSMESRPRTML